MICLSLSPRKANICNKTITAKDDILSTASNAIYHIIYHKYATCPEFNHVILLHPYAELEGEPTNLKTESHGGKSPDKLPQ